MSSTTFGDELKKAGSPLSDRKPAD